MLKEGTKLICSITIRAFVFIFSIGALLLIIAWPRTTRAAILIETVETGAPNSDDEFIRFFNSENMPIDLSKYSLQVKNDDSNTVQKKNFSAGATILPHDIYIVANKNGAFAAQAQMTYSSIHLSDNGGLIALVATTTLINAFDSPNIVAQSRFAKTVTTTPNTTTTIPAPATDTATKTISAVPEFFGVATARQRELPIKISELFPRPNQGEEFIELFNDSSDGVDVAGLWLSDAARNAYSFGCRNEDTIIPPYSYRAWPRSSTTIALNDTDGELVQLFDNFGILDQVRYTNDAPRDASYILTRGAWQWTTTPTPNLPNKFNALALPPIARAEFPNGSFTVGEFINFSATDTTDPNNDLMRVEWNFGDNNFSAATSTQHTYTTAGIYNVVFRAFDASGASSTISHKIIINDNNDPLPLNAVATTFTSASTIKAATANAIAAVSITAVTTTPAATSALKKTAAVPTPPTEYFTATVSVPPGILGARKFIADGTIVETTTPRPELLNLLEGTQIKYSAQILVIKNNLIHKITKRDKIKIVSATQPPAPTIISGTISSAGTDGTFLKTAEAFYNLLNANQYKKFLSNGATITATGFELKNSRPNDSHQKTLVLVGPNAIITNKENRAATPATALLLLFGSAGIYALLHIFITRYGKNFYHPPNSRNWLQTIKKKIWGWCKNARYRFTNYAHRIVERGAQLFGNNYNAHR